MHFCFPYVRVSCTCTNTAASMPLCGDATTIRKEGLPHQRSKFFLIDRSSYTVSQKTAAGVR